MMPEADGRIAVLLIDPDEYARAGLRAVLRADERFAVVGDTAVHGVSIAQHLRPMLILADPSRGGQFDGAMVAELAAAVPDSRICIRTSELDPNTLLRAFEAGALGYFFKADADSAFLHDALEMIVRDGAAIVGPGVVAALQARQRERHLRFRAYEPDDVKLPDRESEVLTLMVTELTDQQIADRLGVARTTVETYVRRLKQRFGVESRGQLIARAIRLGLLDE